MTKQHHNKLGAVCHEGGTHFSVWAPFAEAIWLAGDFNDWSQTATPLEKDESTGIWYVDVSGAEPGQEYKYAIQSGGEVALKNDPRALQLSSSGKSSILVEPKFDWQEDDFQLGPANKQVIYELHIGTFHRPDPATTGTFYSAIEKLDYLASLGITIIELMPCSETRTRRWWGYTPEHFYAVEAAYGGRHALMSFVKAAHQRGIGVILDVVYNHLTAEPDLDLLQFDGWSENNMGGIYFYNDWRAVTPWGNTRLDYGRAEVRHYITDNVRMWLADYHIDGLRVDATNYIRNVNGHDNEPATDIPEGWQLLQEITSTARKTKSSALLIAEDTANNEYITKPTTETGAGFNAQWDLAFPYWLRRNLSSPDDSQRSLQEIEAALTKAYNGQPFQNVRFSESHDLDANGHRRLNEEIAPGDAENVFARRRSTLAAAIVLTCPGIPMLFQGQEFMEDGSFSHWQELDWQKAETFAGTVQLYRDLIALRRNLNGVSTGLLGEHFKTLHFSQETKVFAYHRWLAGGQGDDTIVVLNFSNEAKHNYTVSFPTAGIWKVRFNSDWQGYSNDFHNTATPDITVEVDSGTVNIAPYSALILSQDSS